MSVNPARSFTSLRRNLSLDICNAKMTHSDTGLELDIMGKDNGMTFVPSSDYGTLKEGELYYWYNGFKLAGMKKHTHSADSEGQGGLQAEVFISNIGNCLIAAYNTFNKNMFFTEVGNSGVAAADEISGSLARVKFATSTTLNGYTNGRIFGVPLGFDKNSAFMTRIEHEGNLTSYNERWGVNAERIDAAINNAQGSYGFEACAADTKVLSYSGDGTTRTTLATAYDNDVNIHTWLALHEPGLARIRFIRDVNFTPINITTKSTNVPISGQTEDMCLWGCGIRRTVASAEKILRFMGLNLYGQYSGNISWRYYLASVPV